MKIKNLFDQIIGEDVKNWKPLNLPNKSKFIGDYCSLELLSIEKHAKDLYDSFSLDKAGLNWTYIFCGPFADFDEFKKYFMKYEGVKEPLFYSIISKDSNKAVGVAAYNRINPADGVIEVGHIHYSPLLQKKPAATEAMYLLMRYVFEELGYRRYEWKCDNLNEGSHRAAKRLGFTFEGVFRQHMIYKNRSRDTAWYSILNKDWPSLKVKFQNWRCLDNFDSKGSQKTAL